MQQQITKQTVIDMNGSKGALDSLNAYMMRNLFPINYLHAGKFCLLLCRLLIFFSK